MSQIVRKAASILRRGGGGRSSMPLWYDTVANKYPPLTFEPPSPVELRPAHLRRSPKSGRKGFTLIKFGQETSTRVPKQPGKVEYPEDKYRRRFFKEYPEELYKPMVMQEDHKDACQDVIQLQLKLMEERAGMHPEEAYRIACEKFEQDRLKAAIAERLASEELMAQTGKTESLADSIIETMALAELEVIREANRK